MAVQSASLYQQHGSGDSGANVLDKAARMLEESAPEKAVQLYQQAADVSSVSVKINKIIIQILLFEIENYKRVLFSDWKQSTSGVRIHKQIIPDTGSIETVSNFFFRFP